jgi:hypothetical protein
MTQAVPFTDAEVVDLKRYAGYPAGSGLGFTYLYNYGIIDLLLPRMTDAEQVVARSYLATLANLESAIPAATDNLDTDQAAVWYHNKNEVADRSALFDAWRRRLCAFLGVPPGPGMDSGGYAQLIRT